MKVTPGMRKAITKKIDELFLNMKARLLGSSFKGPAIYFEAASSANPTNTIEGIFRHTLGTLYGPNAIGSADKDTIEGLSAVTGNYIDAHKHKIVNQILHAISQADSASEAVASVKENLENTNSYMNLLVSAQTRDAQAYAEREGITKLGASIGVSDPNVAKLGVIDQKMCKNCRKLWHTKNLQVPKVYRLSELSEGYMKIKKGEEAYPTIGNTHPNCRHTMTMIPPNFGFDASGTIIFKGFGYDVLEDQRSGKS